MGYKLISDLTAPRKIATMLAGTPPIQGIMHTIQNDGIDLYDGSRLDQWLNRLEALFRQSLMANTNFEKIRFISNRLNLKNI